MVRWLQFGDSGTLSAFPGKENHMTPRQEAEIAKTLEKIAKQLAHIAKIISSPSPREVKTQKPKKISLRLPASMDKMSKSQRDKMLVSPSE
jgi:hypothetical protein